MYSIQVGMVCTNLRHSWPVVEVPSACTPKTWRGTIVGGGFAKKFHHGRGKCVEKTHENPQKIQSYMEYPMYNIFWETSSNLYTLFQNASLP